ncbi:MAG: preprotein translocase subunit SecG [Verrucomicrobia bacterium]|nr:preprotein translocase subunit SecG [Verrucomicrobiota bacterium]
MINLVIYILLGVNILTCILLTLLVLMQKPRSEGLGAAFGGNFTESIFGAQTSDVLTKATIWLGAIFMTLTLALGLLYSHRTVSNNKLQEELSKPIAPALTNTLSTNAVALSTNPATTNAVPPPVVPVPTKP